MLRMACVLFLILLKACQEDATEPPMTIMQVIRSYGYPAENYEQIRTPDGYMLTLHRIPYGKRSTKRKNRPVVFLMHGILCSSIDWVNMGPGYSIVYDLAEAGYDVWMGNARGYKLSKAHTHLNPILNSKKFWSFSWHEIGYYDVPAMIDFVLTKTNQKKLSYIGHSQGATTFFVMASTRPQYNQKIKLMVALAPVVFVRHLWNTFLRLLASINNPIQWSANLFGRDEFHGGTSLLNMIGKNVCVGKAIARSICASEFFMICGWDSKQLNKSTIPRILSTLHAGAATRQFVHYAQGIKSAEFRQYDFGPKENVRRYRSAKPPEYNLKNVRVPVSLVFADNDWLSSPRDIQRLRRNLSNVVDVHRVPFSKFNHLDFLFAVKLKTLVNNHVVNTLLEWN